jgi:hypothetical protein
MSAFLSVDLLTEFAAFCLTDFFFFRYRLEIHSLMVSIFDPACDLLPPWKKELYGTCVLLNLYCNFSLTSSSLPPPPFPMYSLYRQCATCGGGGELGGEGVEMYCGPYLQEFYTLFLTRFKT